MKNESPRVSVIVITYNQQETIAAALESVLAQECAFPFEVVVGDDGSTDNTRNICEQYAKKYSSVVRLMPKEPNKGLVRNYFDCFAACRGEYVADCAGDDTWASTARLAGQVEYLDSHQDKVAVISDWNVVENGVSVCSSDMSRFARWRCDLSGKEAMVRALGSRADFPLLSAMLFRRKPLMRILESNPDVLCRPEWGCEDVPLLVAMASVGDIGYLSLVASNYMIYDGTTSHKTMPDKLFDYHFRAAVCVADLCRIYKVETDDVENAIEIRLNYLASLAFMSVDPVRRDKIESLCRSYKSGLSNKTKLYLKIMKYPALWKLAGKIKLKFATKL